MIFIKLLLVCLALGSHPALPSPIGIAMRSQKVIIGYRSVNKVCSFPRLLHDYSN